MDWSFQLYTARNFQPWPDVLKIVADAGFTQVEGFGGVYDDPAAMRADLDRNGLSMPSAHFSIDMLENDFAKTRSLATTFGVKLMVCPYIVAEQRPTDQAGWTALGRRLDAICKRANDAGYGFAWHNHDFEVKPIADGSYPQTLLLEAAPDMGWEMDVAWIARGGEVPWPWIERYASRIVAVHVKDIAKPGEGLDEDGWSDVGHGVMEWKRLIQTLKAQTPARYYILEQDNPNDLRRFARRSFEAVSSY